MDVQMLNTPARDEAETECPGSLSLFTALRNYTLVERAASELRVKAEARMSDSLDRGRALLYSSEHVFGVAAADDCAQAVENCADALANYKHAEQGASEMVDKARTRLLEDVKRARVAGASDDLCKKVASVLGRGENRS